MGEIAFGYKCQECGQGVVRERTIPEYHTRIKGYPFVVKDARIGVCDRCGAEHFVPQETDRWEQIFSVEQGELFLKPIEIQRLRKSLGLTMEQFAVLIGCTRQSLHNWERPDRLKSQSRMADLLLKIVRDSFEKGEVDVLRFLAREAEQLGVHLDVRNALQGSGTEPISLHAKRVPSLTLSSKSKAVAQLAADTSGDKTTMIVESDSAGVFGKLSYDYLSGSLELHFAESPEFDQFDVAISFTDGTVGKAEAVPVQNQRATVLQKTKRTEDNVSQVVLFPRRKSIKTNGAEK